MVKGRKPMKRAMSKMKSCMLKAARPAFRAALPLIASSMTSCAPDIIVPETTIEDPCAVHNDSTIILNEREFETDRRVAGIDGLRGSDSLMSDELVHAVRSSHNLATSGLPEQFQTAFTQLEEECFVNPETGLLGTAYAVTPDSNQSGDYGVYTHLSELNLDDFSLIAHEIGHLQMPCGEFGAEVNAAEQMLMLFVAYSNQENSVRDENRWAAQATNQIYGLEAIRDALRHIYQETFQLDPDPATSMRMHPKWRYIKADIYILDRLLRYDGDFSAVREEITNQQREDLQAVARESVRRFVERYSHTDIQTAFAEIIAEIRMAHYSELSRRFGAQTANDYFDSNSHAAYWMSEPREIVRVIGLEDMNCMSTDAEEDTRRVHCAQGCLNVGGANAIRITDTHFRCFAVEGDDTISFQNWNVTASGMRYLGVDGSQITANSVSYEAIVRFDVVVMDPIEPQ
ncbi:hypothetical protein KKE92_06605 [Candidatus Micrarchaeota archaeon]|nr:hypothetical protein [Candidatus Micrarchaeota archaeon]